VRVERNFAKLDAFWDCVRARILDRGH
jgi:hypothetical protein